ncbi:hypothetical protein D9615_009731 [Tricholomella constricta]|uniref:DUF7918 domain-containing protein n=1 Tax=Tricholomella constricta TaxID=117010 RepID=A0A8H5GTD0_9AGAR|nr:hypothetical protein D9615_009731 [Tricholomella constricta]
MKLTDENSKTAFCWIPSETGKSFAVKWKTLEPRPFDTFGTISVDGVDIGGSILLKDDCQLISETHYVTSATTERPLFFGPIQLTDDDAYLKSDSLHLGNIVVRIKKIEKVEKMQPNPRDTQLEDKIHEKSKKAMVNRVKFGEEVPRDSTESYSRVKTGSTLATLTFKYRSIGKSNVLRAHGISPDPSAQKTRRKRKIQETDSSDGSVEDDTETATAELRSLLRGAQEQIYTILPRLEKKVSKAAKKSAKKIKKEP